MVFNHSCRYFCSIYTGIITYLAKPTMTTGGLKKCLALCSENLPKLLLWQLKDDIVLTTHKGYLLSPSAFYHVCSWFVVWVFFNWVFCSVWVFFKLMQFVSFSPWYIWGTFWSSHRDEFLGLGSILSVLKWKMAKTSPEVTLVFIKALICRCMSEHAHRLCLQPKVCT